MTLQVLAPGVQTTVQDQGRCGHRHLGIALAGALDPRAAALANRLVGNDDGAAVLEITLQGPTLRFDAPIRIAVLGADPGMRFGDIELPAGRPLDLPPGTLSCGALRGGARAWLAISGGIAVSPVLGSRSTDLRGGFGGFEGRALRKGDVLGTGDTVIAEPKAPRIPAWWIDPHAYDVPDTPLRLLPTAHPALPALAGTAWQVDPRSDRQGLRLQGEALAATAADGISSPVAPGTIQLPPDGQPIVLLADAQTVGGYPVLGHVIGHDLPRLARLGPHARLRFVACDRAEAWRLARAARAQHARLTLAIDRRLRDWNRR